MRWSMCRLAAPWLSACLALAAHAAPEAQFVATPLQGDPCVAPCAVHFDAIGNGQNATVDPDHPRAFHTLLFEWDFGDPAAGTWSITGADKNEALGAIAGHLYAQPGTYTVTLAVTNPYGERSVAQSAVVVAGPDAVFAAGQTWCFANSGDPGGAGFESCPTTLSSRHVVIAAGTAGGFEAALASCATGGQKGRCLFRAGDSFRSIGIANLSPTTPGPGLVSRFGAGANPQITGGSGFLGLGDRWTVAHFDVGLDSSADSPGPLFLLFGERQRVLVWDVRARGLGAACFESATGGGATFHSDLVGIVELDCVRVPGPGVAGLYLRAERVLVLGNSVDDGYEGHFTLRTVHFPRSIVQHNRLQRPQEDATNQHNSIQLRSWAGAVLPAASPTEWVIVSDNVISQDNSIEFIRTCQTNDCVDSAQAPDLRDVLFERNFLFLSTGGAGGRGRLPTAFWLQGGDLTVRNNVVDLQGIDPSNVPPEQIRLVRHDANMPSAPGLRDDRVHVLNNVIYFDEASTRSIRLCQSFGGSGHECRNNLAWLPNHAGEQLVDDENYLSSDNVFATENPFVGAVPQQSQTSAEDFVPGSESSEVVDSGYDFANGPSQVALDFARRCRPADGDAGGGPAFDVGAFEVAAGSECRLAGEVGCMTGFDASSFSVSETRPGQERLKAKLGGGPFLAQPSLGNPTVPGGTIVALHVFDDVGALVTTLEVDRAGASCEGAPCWKAVGGAPPTGKGFSYNDRAASASGVRSLKLVGGSAGKSSLSLSAANQAKKGQTALPTGIADALSATTSVTLELHTSDAACFSATLSDVIRQEPGVFEAR